MKKLAAFVYRSVILALVLSAVLAIYVVLFGGNWEWEDKIILTLFLFDVFSILSVSPVSLLSKSGRVVRNLGLVALAQNIFSFLFFMFEVWLGFDRFFGRNFVQMSWVITLMVLPVSFSIMCLVLLFADKGKQIIKNLKLVAISSASIATAFSLSLIYEVTKDPGDIIFKLTIVSLILLVLSILLILVLILKSKGEGKKNEK